MSIDNLVVLLWHGELSGRDWHKKWELSSNCCVYGSLNRAGVTCRSVSALEKGDVRIFAGVATWTRDEFASKADFRNITIVIDRPATQQGRAFWA